MPRRVENPELRVSNFCYVVDYVQTLKYAAPERVGVLGICGGGRYAINASMTDHRLKCCVGITAVNFGRLVREALGGFDPVVSLEQMAKQRTLEAQGAERYVMQYLPDTVEQAKKTTEDIDVLEATEYYKTSRGQQPCGASNSLFSFSSAAVAWDAFNRAEITMTRPLLVIIGRLTGGFGAYRDGHEIYTRAASEEKELVEIPDVSHYQLYDVKKATQPALERVIPFLQKHLGSANLQTTFD